MRHYNLLGQEIEVGDLVFQVDTAHTSFLIAGKVSRFTESNVYFNMASYDAQGNHMVNERKCKLKYIFKTNLEGLLEFINAPNTNEYRKEEVKRLIEHLID